MSTSDGWSVQGARPKPTFVRLRYAPPQELTPGAACAGQAACSACGPGESQDAFKVVDGVGSEIAEPFDKHRPTGIPVCAWSPNVQGHNPHTGALVQPR